jgi:acetyl esterase/lipase
VINPLTSGAGLEVGQSTLSAYYTTSPGFVDVSSLAEIRLEAGAQFKAKVCLNVHVLGSVPEGQCVTTDIDTRPATTSTTHTVALSKNVAQPALGNSGYATQQVVVTYAQGALLADSWPADNLPGASVPLFAVGATSGWVPEQQGVLLDSTPAHGGANTSLPDSMCVSNPWPPATPRDDLDDAALGPMPFHYEVGEPSGAHAGRPPRGVLILFHGGGWFSNGGGAAQALRGDADRWRARGWRTVNSSYRPCGLTLVDALSLYDRVRETYGGASPVCTLGQSAGGHLALMVAAHRPGGVSCVINQAGPTDPLSIAGQGAFDSATGGVQTNGPKAAFNTMVAAFGQENLPAYSPVQLADPGLTGTRILAVTAVEDPLIPYGQMTLLRDVIREHDHAAYVDTMQLTRGDRPFVHGYVSQAALDAYHQAEQDLVAPLEAGLDTDRPPAQAAPPPVADQPPITGMLAQQPAINRALVAAARPSMPTGGPATELTPVSSRSPGSPRARVPPGPWAPPSPPGGRAP